MTGVDPMRRVLGFWFETLESKDWFRKSDRLDAEIRDNFEVTYEQVVAGETAHWRDVPDGRLAEIIVLDQFSRNMFRGTPKMFAADPLALALAQEAVRSGDDKRVQEAHCAFIYMPYMHSETRKVHEEALKLFDGTSNLKWEIQHKAIIDRFGRYPHRNDILGRESTPEEIEWLRENSGF